MLSGGWEGDDGDSAPKPSWMSLVFIWANIGVVKKSDTTSISQIKQKTNDEIDACQDRMVTQNVYY